MHRVKSTILKAPKSFLSNGNEQKYLKSRRGQNDLAQSLYEAFAEYKTRFDERNMAVEKNGEQRAHFKMSDLRSDTLNDLSLTQGTLYGIQIFASGQFFHFLEWISFSRLVEVCL